MNISKPWLDNYPPGIDDTVRIPDDHQNLADRLLGACMRYAARAAIVCGSDRLTYSDLDRQSRQVAAGFLACGLKKGDRVALMCPNVPQLPVARLAALRLGLVVVNVNPQYTARELKHQLNDSAAVAMVVAESALPVFDSIIDDTSVRLTIVVPAKEGTQTQAERQPHSFRIDFSELLSGSQELPTVQVSRGDLAFLQYTGGTTGLSKGAMLTHGNVLSNLAQIEKWVSPDDDARFRVVTALPLYHIMALTLNELLFLGRGAELVLVPNARDAATLMDELCIEPPGFITGVNTLFGVISRHPRSGQIDFSRLHATLGGGTAILQGVAQEWQKISGKPIVQGYGLSEASPVLTICRLDQQFDGSIGYPVPATDIQIRDPETGQQMPEGERGEICAAGPQVMQGYWGRLDAASTFHPDGYLRTGDVGIMESDGRIRIVDRTKDVILVSGFNVYPTEIEDVLSEHAAVVEAACIGVPDERTGEAIRAFVVCSNTADVTTTDLEDFCRLHLTAYKVPRQFEFVKEIPKSAVGKILRRELRALR